MDNAKKILVIINPCSGKYTVKSQLWNIADMFTRAGFQTTVYTTQKRGDATEYAKLLADKFDTIVCRGGDGTFNEVVNGVMQSGIDVPVGYIPSGTTNDFANSIGVPTNVQDAIDLICEVDAKQHDIGRVNNSGRFFNYTASFGIFTKSSYSVSQKKKNMFGYPAYIVDGLKEIKGYRPLSLRIECDDAVYEGEYAFGAITSALVIAGLIKYTKEQVSFNDGIFELNLAKLPKGGAEWREVATDVLFSHKYNQKYFTLAKGSHFVIESMGDDIPWTLDGEYGGSYKITEIDCVHNAFKVYRS